MMWLPLRFRNRLWERSMKRLVRNQLKSPLPENFVPAKCILLYPAGDPEWSRMITGKHPFWSDKTRDFAFIGYLPGKPATLPEVRPPYHLLDETQLENDFGASGAWLERWKQPADLLVVANPETLKPISHLAASLPAICKVSLYDAEFGELYQLMLSSGGTKPEERLNEIFHYLQKIMKL